MQRRPKGARGGAQEILEGLKSAEEGIEARLYRWLARELTPFIVSRIGRQLLSRIDVEDILQQIVSRVVFAVREQATEIRDLASFARGCARRMVASEARRRSVCFHRLDAQPKRPSSAAESTIAGKSPDPLAGVLAAERRELVRQALEQLGPAEADILRLRFFRPEPNGSRLTFREIGRIVGKSPEAAEKAYARAKEKLRGSLEMQRALADSSIARQGRDGRGAGRERQPPDPE